MQGHVRSIGVSNFGVGHLQKLLETAQVPPAVNQVELSPYLQRKRLVSFCRENDILLAVSPDITYLPDDMQATLLKRSRSIL